MDLLERYLEHFHDYPPKYKMTSYDDPIYQKLLDRALKTNKPIDKRAVGYAYRGKKIDHC